MSKLLAFLGAILMAHAAISVGQFRGIMKERGDADASIPFDIIIEVHFHHIIKKTLLILVSRWYGSRKLRIHHRIEPIRGILTFETVNGQYLLFSRTYRPTALYPQSPSKPFCIVPDSTRAFHDVGDISTKSKTMRPKPPLDWFNFYALQEYMYTSHV